MAMSGEGLGAYIYDKLVDEHATDDGKALALANLTKLGEAIVEYITSNAQVTVTVQTTGTAAAQSGTGSGSIT